jgi:hypothetical protein
MRLGLRGGAARTSTDQERLDRQVGQRQADHEYGARFAEWFVGEREARRGRDRVRRGPATRFKITVAWGVASSSRLFWPSIPL